MRIRELGLENVGVFDSERIEFNPCPSSNKAEIHILTGQNGTGKSTVLMALANLFDLEHFQEFKDRPELSSRSINLYCNSLFKRLRLGNSSVRYVVEAIGQKRGYEFHFTRTNQRFAYHNKFNYTDKIAELLVEYGARANAQKSPFRYSPRFVAFAMSGYRRVKSESVNALSEPKDFNPLWQALEFDKTEEQGEVLSINQLLANNISKSAIERGRDDAKAKRFATVVRSIEDVINQITGWTVQFDLRTEPTSLVTIVNDREIDFDTLPDGLKSLVSWIADILCRVDLLSWRDSSSILEKEMILFLDEIEVHLHPEWQRKVLPVVQSLFKNAQIFVSTHSPFVVNSVDDAWIHRFEFEKGFVHVRDAVRTEDSASITQVLREVFGIDQWFGIDVQRRLDRFRELKRRLMENGIDDEAERELIETARSLADEPNDQLKQIVRRSLTELETKKDRHFSL